MGRLDVSTIEEIVDYTWRDKACLLQAFTHPSYGENRITESYERLGLLGDAVLDYLVTCYIFCNTDAEIEEQEVSMVSNKGDFLVLHLSELVRMCFMAATSDSDPLRLEGL